MSTKAKKAPKSASKSVEMKNTDKKEGKSASGSAKKSKGSDSEELGDEVVELSTAPVIEEEEEEEMSSSSSGGGSAAALAAASISPTEGPGSLKNFRHHPDMENFYRFIYENDLRLEALQILDEMMEQRALKKNVKSAKAQAH